MEKRAQVAAENIFKKLAKKEKDKSRTISAFGSGALLGGLGGGIHGAVTAPEGEKAKRGAGQFIGGVLGNIAARKFGGGLGAQIAGQGLGTAGAHKLLKEQYKNSK